MISKAHRFHGYGSLRFVYSRGQVVRGQYCQLKYIRNERQTEYRVAVVVSRKVHKSAVVRNRIRRRLYEIVREVGERITAPYDLVFIVYNDCLADLPAPELKQTVLDQLEKAKVLPKGKARGQGSAHAIVNKEEK